jgi:hypothetical protein
MSRNDLFSEVEVNLIVGCCDYIYRGVVEIFISIQIYKR